MTAARITKRAVVLGRLAGPGHGPSVLYGPPADQDLPTLIIDAADFTALGSPERITVTISPEGDPT